MPTISRRAWFRNTAVCCAALSFGLPGPGVAQQDGTNPALVAPPLPDSATLTRIAFGSCAGQDQDQPIWDPIVAIRPQLFLFIGDNIYGDTQDMDVLRAKYVQLAAKPGYRKMKATCPILATWDDHDFGVNDGGADYPKRKESQQIMLDFFDEPANSPRRRQEGVYDARVFGPEGRRVQIILLDTRYHRTPIQREPLLPGQRREPFRKETGADATVLGAAQWTWLEEQLKKPAEVRILVSSIQVVPEDHPDEKWAVFPPERERLFRLIRDTNAAGLFVISGDRHLAELSMMNAGIGYPLYDLTSSGMTKAAKNWRTHEVNQHRVATMNWGDNFGLIEIDWERADKEGKPDPLIRLSIRDVDGEIRIQEKVRLATLKPGVLKAPEAK